MIFSNLKHIAKNYKNEKGWREPAAKLIDCSTKRNNYDQDEVRKNIERLNIVFQKYGLEQVPEAQIDQEYRAFIMKIKAV